MVHYCENIQHESLQYKISVTVLQVVTGEETSYFHLTGDTAFNVKIL